MSQSISLLDILTNAATTSENRECVQGKGGKMPIEEKTDQCQTD